MTRYTRFDAGQKRIVVPGWLEGPLGETTLRLVLDTAASETTIAPRVIDGLGYNPRDGETPTTVTSALGKEYGYRTRIARLEALGFSIADLAVNVFDFADGDLFDGLIGLNFLQSFNYQVRSAEHCIVASTIRPMSLTRPAHSR